MMSKIKTRPFDAANYLNDEEDVAAYLAAVMEEGDPALLAAHIVSLFQDWYVKRWKYRAAKVGVDAFADSVVLLIRSHLK